MYNPGYTLVSTRKLQDPFLSFKLFGFFLLFGVAIASLFFLSFEESKTFVGIATCNNKECVIESTIDSFLVSKINGIKEIKLKEQVPVNTVTFEKPVVSEQGVFSTMKIHIGSKRVQNNEVVTFSISFGKRALIEYFWQLWKGGDENA